MSDKNRGTGRTSRQMREAPVGAIFVWLSADLHYARALAASLGRQDLEIVRPEVLDDRHRLAGRSLSGLVIDHAAALTMRQACIASEIAARISRGQNHVA